MHAEGEGEDEMCWEIRCDINTLPCVKEMASGNRWYGQGAQLRAL